MIESGRTSGSGPAALATAAVFAAAVAFHASYAFHGIALFDEGLLADGGWRVREGAVIGRVVFLPYGPASYWLLAPCFALFGQSLVTLRWVAVVLQALADAAVFKLAVARSTPLGALLGSALLAVAHGSLHKSFLLLAAILALCAAAALSRRPGAGAAASAGALAGLAFLFRHDAGAFALAALAAAALCEASPLRAPLLLRLGALAGGFLAVAGPAFLALLAAGLDPRAWWEHEWQRIAVQERIDVGLAPPVEGGEWRWGRAALLLALLAAPFAHVAWGGGAILRRLRGRALAGDVLRIAAALFGLLLLNQARLIPSANHLFQAFAPVALALADLCARRGRGRLAHAALALIVVAVAAWAALGRGGPYSGTFKQRIPGAVRLDLPAGGVRLEPALAQDLRAVVAAIQARVAESETIATSPGCPLLGFLSQRRLALPYAEPSYYYFDPRLQLEAIAALERARPPVFVSDGRRPANYRFEEAAPLVVSHLARTYRPVESIGPFTVFARVR
jgi:hypothetical protein